MTLILKDKNNDPIQDCLAAIPMKIKTNTFVLMNHQITKWSCTWLLKIKQKWGPIQIVFTWTILCKKLA